MVASALKKPDGSEVDRHVGERIRRRRAEMGLTQEDLGRVLEISYQQIQKYETGANRISAGRLFEVASALSADVAYFFDGYAGSKPASALPHGGHNRAAIELVRNFLELKDETLRNAVTTLLRALRDQQERGAAE
ncbi:MAG: helix-turn-helix transcriptional regulator [Rhizomicrobium sp.]|jgi:transcriptional regulator with XRE-family HTH domain